jgi:hypothetical protein
VTNECLPPGGTGGQAGSDVLGDVLHISQAHTQRKPDAAARRRRERARQDFLDALDELADDVADLSAITLEADFELDDPVFVLAASCRLAEVDASIMRVHRILFQPAEDGAFDDEGGGATG